MLRFGNPAFNPAAPRAGANLTFSEYGVPGGIPRVSDFMTATNTEASRNRGDANQGVNTTQVDGQTGFFEALSGFGSALLSGLGVQGEREAQRARQVGFFTEPEPQGIQTEQLVMIGLVGAGLYFAFRS